MQAMLFVIALSLMSAPVLAQYPCTGSVLPPAFLVTCPCLDGAGQGVGEINLFFTGTARIGTVQQYRLGGNQSQPLVLLVGLPAATPVPIPPGMVACSSQAFASVPTFHIDPVLIVSPFFPVPLDSYWLAIPPNPEFVGYSIYAQSFNLQSGLGSPPWRASEVIGFTIQA